MSSNKIPRYIAKQYAGGAREFKSEKRRQLRALSKSLNDLRWGCAALPSRSKHVDAIRNEIEALQHEMSVKNWGR